MKTCGIEIDNNKVVLVCLEKNDEGTVEISKHSTKIALDDHENSSEVRTFLGTIASHLDTIGADSICIIKRQMKGQFAAGGLSFKIEGLVQCYAAKDVVLISGATIKAFLKKNPNSIVAKYKYQQSALNAAFYLMNK